MLKIILTGPESSGKTTLIKELSDHFNTSFIKEYAREYINKLDTPYSRKDLLNIAKKQLELEQLDQDLLFCDTDLITIKIWSLVKYKICDPWILDNIMQQTQEDRFYLLCKPDIPWEADSQREYPGKRKELFLIYENELKTLGHPYIIIEGANRLQITLNKLSAYINTYLNKTIL